MAPLLLSSMQRQSSSSGSTIYGTYGQHAKGLAAAAAAEQQQQQQHMSTTIAAVKLQDGMHRPDQSSNSCSLTVLRWQHTHACQGKVLPSAADPKRTATTPPLGWACGGIVPVIGLPLNKGQDFGFTPNKRPDYENPMF
jgi:hypothetical protein